MSEGLPQGTPLGRLAPSPTGLLHLGHARTFVLAWAHARQRGGAVLLRMDDLDGSRCRPEYVEETLRDLEWLGLDFVGQVAFQSSTVPRLARAAEQLVEAGLAYPCACTRADIEAAIAAPQRGVTERRYPGTCRGRFASLLEAREQFERVALRFRTTPDPVGFFDGVAGDCAYSPFDEVGDFVLVNRQGTPAYQLASVVNDADQGVTEVFRGDDLLASTARQLALSSALGLSSPSWYHVPLVVDEWGRRLAKRRDDLSLKSLRQGGTDARAVLSWVARSAGLGVGDRPCAAQIATAFDLERLSRSPVTLTRQDVARLIAAR